MPIHDWTCVDAGLFHAFHQTWMVGLSNALNAGILPSPYFALVEQRVPGPIPDILTLRLSPANEPRGDGTTALAAATAPPATRIVRRSEAEIYAAKADRITVRHRHGDVVAVIEIVSPGNKASRAEFRSFVEKVTALIRHAVHVLVVDLFPPGPRDPHGVHKAIWDEFEEEEFAPPPGKPLVLAAYDAGPIRVAYVEPVGVGDPLPEMPVFLKPEYYVRAPLEATYMAAWQAFPAAMRLLLEDASETQRNESAD